MKVLFDLGRAPDGKRKQWEMIRNFIENGFCRLLFQMKRIGNSGIPTSARIIYLVLIFKQIQIFLDRFIGIVNMPKIKILLEFINTEVLYIFGIFEDIFF